LKKSSRERESAGVATEFGAFWRSFRQVLALPLTTSHVTILDMFVTWKSLWGRIAASRRRQPVRFWIALWCAVSLLLWAAGCVTTAFRPPPDARCITVPMLLTGYCNCGKCCSWHRTWLGLGSPVIDAGPHRGDPKKVGYTSNGTEARHGTIAADTSRYPYGTIVEIPGYGMGRVDDTGSAIKGDHMDLWFPDHEQAMRWGKQQKTVRVWIPAGRRYVLESPPPAATNELPTAL